VSDHDNRNDAVENGDGERVVVRDRRRIDPVTGEVRSPAEESAGGGPDATPEQQAGEATGPDAVAAAELAAQVAERTADLQRVTAEYANYRRRVERDRENVQINARVQLMSELVTVLDDIERAEAHGDLTGPFKAVADKLVAVTQKLGLEPFGMEGEPFDPSVHEAVQHEPSTVDGPTVTVISSVLRRGYRIADRVLRPAMVAVADRPDELGSADRSEEDGTSTTTDPAEEP
jgi:molecular chaperone GrpE